MTAKSALISLGVLALFLTIFVPLVLRVRGGRDRAFDAERLRRTYVALALYESEHDGFPAPNLSCVRRDIEPIDLTSVDDPKANRDPKSIERKTLAFPYSWDGVIDTGVRSSRPVSWSYRYHWPGAGAPLVTSLDRRCGLLADPWPGTLLRVMMDGAIVEKPRGEPTFKGLFGK